MTRDSIANIDISTATQKLLVYCRSSNWAGYDPYDALNSRLFTTVPLLNRRIPRLVLTQTLKRIPLNLRPLLAIPKTQNPKGLALSLSALIKLVESDAENQAELEELIGSMIERIIALRSSSEQYGCWGYSFPWQTRTIVVPAGTPNLVCTTFVASALFEAYDHTRDTQCLKLGISAAEYLLNELYWSEDGAAGFGYPLPSVRNQVHNANFLGAALLCRAYRYTQDERFLLPALEVARYSVGQQRMDGSWLYGESASQHWIDNFHTGFNLCALRAISGSAGTTEFDAAILRGFEFYRQHFINPDGVARYFHDQTYPIDIHSVAQSIITLLTFKDVEPENLSLAHSVLRWALTHMWDDRGFFYYRVLRSHTNRISYMRWSQAWMFLAMSMLLEASAHDSLGEAKRRLVGATLIP